MLLLETVQTCSLGQITEALFEVGGQYRRNMLDEDPVAGRVGRHGRIRSLAMN